MNAADEPFNTIIPTHVVSRDLSDAEFAELDELLAATPEPYAPLDAVMLDGYLCGVLVQPVLLEPAVWLPYVFDTGGEPLSEYIDATWRERCTTLILRRHAALTRALAEDGWFDPLILEYDDDEAGTEVVEGAELDPVEGEADVAASLRLSPTLEAGSGASPDEASAPDEVSVSADPAAALPAVSKPLMPWVAGFQHASQCFPDLHEIADGDVAMALARLYRHLPGETDKERQAVALLDRELPLATLDDAIEELVAAVADLSDLTRDARYRVETVRRETPKVGRNDACPCGSGKKFKHCHGR